MAHFSNRKAVSVSFRLILTLIASLACAHSATAYVGDYDGIVVGEPIGLKRDSTFLVDCEGINAERQRIEFGFKPTQIGKFGVEMTFNDSIDNHVISLNARLCERNKYDFDHDASIVVSLSIDGMQQFEKDFGNKLPTSKSPIYIRTEFTGEKIIVSAGGDDLDIAGKINYVGFIDNVTIRPQYDLVINRYSSLHIPRPIIPQLYADGKAVGEALSKCENSNCGIWTYFDEEVETRVAMKGGRYKLAMLPADDGGYDLIYLSGAEVDPYRWNPGALKGHLIPTPFANTFTLYWIDSAGKEIADETPYASIEGAIMTLVFPLQKAKFRFVKNN